MSGIAALFKSTKNQLIGKSKTKQPKQKRNEKDSIQVVVTAGTLPTITPTPIPQKTTKRLHGTPQAMEYYAEVLQTMRHSEKKYMPKRDFMSTVQKDINWEMRGVLVDWLIEVTREYQMDDQTLHLSVNYVDRMLSIHSVHRSKLQLVGASCLLLASKYSEIHPPSLEEFVYICDDAYTTAQMRSMESFVLSSLNFCLTVTTAFDFLSAFSNDMSLSAERKFFALYLGDLALGESIHTKYLPSKIASACIFLSCLHLPNQDEYQNYDVVCGYQYEHIESVIQELHVIFIQKQTSDGTSVVRDKYKSPDVHRVSGIVPRHTDLNQMIIKDKKRMASTKFYCGCS